MANYSIPQNPTYVPEVRRLEVTDPAHAETVFNPTLGRIVENVHAVKLLADEANAAMASNMFIVDFATLNGIVVGDGVWNMAAKRLEC